MKNAQTRVKVSAPGSSKAAIVCVSQIKVAVGNASVVAMGSFLTDELLPELASFRSQTLKATDAVLSVAPKCKMH